MIISTSEQPPVIHPVKKTRTRVNRSKAQWKKLVEEYGTSGLTQSAFCRQHKIASSSSFHKWRKRFTSSSTNDFVNITEPLTRTPSPVVSENQPTHPWQVELELGSGMILRVRAS